MRAFGFHWAVIALGCSLFGCPPSGRPLAGDSVCVGVSDGGQPQASVNAGGITIVVPLMKLTRDGGADVDSD